MKKQITYKKSVKSSFSSTQSEQFTDLSSSFEVEEPKPKVCDEKYVELEFEIGNTHSDMNLAKHSNLERSCYWNDKGGSSKLEPKKMVHVNNFWTLYFKAVSDEVKSI